MTTTELAKNVASGDRRALAQAITLVESSRADHRKEAEALLAELAKTGREALRIGLTGSPGVGKSTFIEAFGRMLTSAGKRVAVLAIDPSSARTGGSILGDKTRMPELSRDPNAFVRPSASQSALGGVAAATRSAIALCEGAGFDVVLVETVGVGQSETAVADMTDLFLLLLAPGGGDELQGVKRGIMEMADLLVINKADGEFKDQAARTAADYGGALQLIRPRAALPPEFHQVVTASALEGCGLDELWTAIETLATWRKAEGHWSGLRSAQARRAFETALVAEISRLADTDPELALARREQADRVAEGAATPQAAAAEVIALWRKGLGKAR